MKKYRFDLNLRPENVLIVLLFAGFMIGMILSFLSHGNATDMSYEWLNTSLMYLRYGEINYGDVLFYVLKKRCIVVLFLFLICMTGKGRFLLPLGGAVVGVFCGFYITEFICCKGILGCGLFLITLFPHYICYAYGYYVLVAMLSKGMVRKKEINRLGQSGGFAIAENYGNMLKKYTPIAVVIMGIVLECYVNPFFLKIFLKIFM